MSLDNAPSFDEFPKGMPENLQEQNSRRIRFSKIFLAAALVVVFIGLLNLMKQTRTMEKIAGTGFVSGQVVDQNGQPFMGSIFILGTRLEAKTGPDGSFLVEQVPAGKQTLIVADDLSGLAFDIEVEVAQELQMGKIQFFPTATP